MHSGNFASRLLIAFALIIASITPSVACEGLGCLNPFDPTSPLNPIPNPLNPDPILKVPPSAIPEPLRPTYQQFYKDGEGTKETVEKAGNDIIRTVENANHDVLTTLQQAGGDTIVSFKKASDDTLTTVQRAGTDVVATYEKGWRDTAEQTRRSFNDVVDAVKAVARFTEAQAKGQVTALSNAERRAREGKVIDALWGAAVEPAQSSEKNFANAVQESAVLNAAAQAAAAAYGGPAGAAAYAAWYTYRATGDANLALKAGAFSIVTSYAGGSVANMPAGTAGEVLAGEVLRKAAVTAAVAGIAVAAAGGDEKAVKDAVLTSGGAVLVQGASDQLTAYSPNAENAVQTVQCISARDVDCLSNTTYVRDAEGKLLYDSDGQPRIDTTKLDPKQYVGQWTGIDPNSAEGKKNQIVSGISMIPQTQSIPIGHNDWVVTWTLGNDKTLEYNRPAVVLTNVGPTPAFYSTVKYEDVSKPDATPAVFIAFFDWGSDEVTPEAEDGILRQAAEHWQTIDSRSTVQVTGYTDRSGPPQVNQELSERRVENVINILARMGIPVGNMVGSARGENDNRVPTEPGAREPQNRRVEIVIGR
jgi:outer membrane protein OmpA-like peptidoglycan-associated protein